MPHPVIDENELAQKISKVEGGFIEMDISNIKECVRITFEKLAEYPPGSVVRAVFKHKVKAPKTPRASRKKKAAA